MSYGVALRNGVPFTLGTIAALCVNATTQWNPLSLWPNGAASPGMWISPRTLTSEWQDYTGTTPVVTPGTVADTSNPVGLALDIRAGAPEVLGPELVVNGNFAAGSTGWTLEGEWTVSGGQASITSASDAYVIYQTALTPGKTYEATVTVTDISAGGLAFYCGAPVYSPIFSTTGQYTAILVCGGNGLLGVRAITAGTTASIDNVSFKEVPGNHMLQSTSAARPLMSAYDGQTLGPGHTYDATGYPIFQLYDGVDDGMATAAFTAGTLIDGMDCMIPVRRDSGIGGGSFGIYGDQSGNKFTGFTSTAGYLANFGCGSPTTWVNGVQVAGGTSVTQDVLSAAIPVGEWCILELKNLDLSAWTAIGFGFGYTGYNLNGARGDIMLYPSTASTEDKDAARQYLADYYGVTLP